MTAAELVYCTGESFLHGSLVGSTVCSPSPRHFSPPFRAASTQIHVTGTLCHFGSKDCSSSKQEIIFFPPLKLGESNHFVFHVGIKSKLLLDRFSVGSRLESGSDSRDESNTGSVTDPMFGWSTSLRFSSEISHLYNSDLSLLGSTVSLS